MAADRNLSVPARTLTGMSNSDLNHAGDPEAIFADPVAYLARFGIESTLVRDVPVTDPALPAAA